MPSEAFARIVAARTYLNEVTKLLNESHAGMLNDAQGRERYKKVQAEWDEAHRAFERATEAFDETIRKFTQPEDEAPARLPSNAERPLSRAALPAK